MHALGWLHHPASARCGTFLARAVVMTTACLLGRAALPVPRMPGSGTHGTAGVHAAPAAAAAPPALADLPSSPAGKLAGGASVIAPACAAPAPVQWAPTQDILWPGLHR